MNHEEYQAAFSRGPLTGRMTTPAYTHDDLHASAAAHTATEHLLAKYRDAKDAATVAYNEYRAAWLDAFRTAQMETDKP